MTFKQGWVKPNQPVETITPNCIALKQSNFLGIHLATEKAYLFTNLDNETGTWLSKAMCYGLDFNPDLSVKVTHPVYANTSQTKLEQKC